jgi:hypothetical protein
MILDATRAHFHSPATTETYVKLCAEDAQEGMCGLLGKSMYGTRNAAANWEKFSTGVCKDAGFDIGKTSPCVGNHSSLKARFFKHGDDFVIGGARQHLYEVLDRLGKGIELKCKAIIGPRPDLGDATEGRILNRIVRYVIDRDGEHRLEWEGDPRHVPILLAVLGLDGKAKGVNTPGEKPKNPPNVEELEGGRAESPPIAVA